MKVWIMDSSKPLSEECHALVRRHLSGLKPKPGYSSSLAAERFIGDAATALTAIMTPQADRANSKPSASVRRRLLERYQKSLEIIAGISEEGREGELLKADPYRTVWAEIESAMHQSNLAQIPDIPSFQKAAANIAYAVSQIKREGHPGMHKGLSGREAAVKQAVESWTKHFEDEITTAITSPFVQALNLIEKDVRDEGPTIDATREAIRNVVGKRAASSSPVKPLEPAETADLAERNRHLRRAWDLLDADNRTSRFNNKLADLDRKMKAGLLDTDSRDRLRDWEQAIVEALENGPRPWVMELRRILPQ